MTFDQAKKLHSKDEVRIKKTRAKRRIIDVTVVCEMKAVEIMTDDGEIHRNTEIE